MLLRAGELDGWWDGRLVFWWTITGWLGMVAVRFVRVRSSIWKALRAPVGISALASDFAYIGQARIGCKVASRFFVTLDPHNM